LPIGEIFFKKVEKERKKESAYKQTAVINNTQFIFWSWAMCYVGGTGLGLKILLKNHWN